MGTTDKGSGDQPVTAVGAALKGALAVRAAAEKRIDEILEEASRGLFSHVKEAGRLAAHLKSDDQRIHDVSDLQGLVDGAEVRDELEGLEPRRPRGKGAAKAEPEAESDDKPAASAAGDGVVPSTSPAASPAKNDDADGEEPRRRGKRGGRNRRNKGGEDGGQQADAPANTNPNPRPAPAPKADGGDRKPQGDRPKRTDRDDRPAPRRDDRDSRPRRAFVVIAASAVTALVFLLRRPKPVAELPAAFLRVFRHQAGHAIIERTDRPAAVYVHGAVIEELSGLLEHGIAASCGDVEVSIYGDGNLKLSGPAPRGTGRREDDRPRPQQRDDRDDREPRKGDRPARSERPAPRGEDRGQAPSLATRGKPGTRDEADGRKAHGTDDSAPRGGDQKPTGDRPQRGGDRRPAPPVRFPKGFVEAAAEAVAAFLAGDASVTSIAVTAELLHFGKVEKLEVGEDGMIRPDRAKRFGWSYDNCRAAMKAAYGEGHALAPMMTLPDREALLSDWAIPARKREDGTLEVLPLTRDAVHVVTKEAVERARADIAAAPQWVAHLRAAANRGWSKAIGALKTSDVRTVRKDGSGFDSVSVLDAFGRVCSVKHEHPCDAATVALSAFGRVWAACPAGALGFTRALRMVAGEQAASKKLAALDSASGYVLFQDVIQTWPIAQTEGELKWLPRDEVEADSRLRNEGPYVRTDVRSFGADALTGVWERELSYLLVVQDGDDERSWKGFALSRESAEAFIKAGLAEMNDAIKVDEDVVTYLVDREGALERPPLPIEGERKKKESAAARKAAKDEADKERSDRWRAEQRAMRVVVSARLLAAYAYADSQFYREYVGKQEEGGRKPRSTSKPKGPKRPRQPRTGGGDKPGDPALDARLAKAARKAGGMGGPALPNGLGGSGTPVPKRGQPVPGKKLPRGKKG